MVYIFTNKAASLKTVFPKNAEFVLNQNISSELSKHSPGAGDITYIDVSAVSEEELSKTLTQVKKRCKDSSWGIIDPKGIIKDPAVLFFDGANDYLGTGFLKNSIIVDAKRLKDAHQWRKSLTGISEINNDVKSTGTTEGFLKSGIKLPAVSAFPGWKKMQTGKTMPFYLLFCSLQGKAALESRIGEKVLSQIHKRFASLLVSYLKEADGQLWVDTGKDCLFLLPPRAKSAEAAIKACMRMIVAAPQLVMETLGISLPANFIFALHYGSISYKPPGKTGTVVSDAVNSIFHLGSNKSEAGRLTISSGLPDVSVPKILQDLFAPFGEYEGRKIWHTKKFQYAKPWF
jgi:hypothetical protein